MKFDKSAWIGRTFRCNDTGVEVTLTEDVVRARAFIGVGDGAIDLGDGFYSRRVGNISEVKEDKE